MPRVLSSGFPARVDRYEGKPMTGYKKAYTRGGRHVVVTLRIPADALVVQPYNAKCRTNMAKVLDMHYLNGERVLRRRVYAGWWDTNFEYKRGMRVRPTFEFNTDVGTECGSGIHFFVTKREARRW